MAIVLASPGVREVVRATRYKNIQRLRERAGVFGVDLEHTGGTYASMGGTKGQGIPEEWQSAYRALLQPTEQPGGVLAAAGHALGRAARFLVDRIGKGG